MAYPVFYPFKSRVLNTSVSSNTVSAVASPARAKLLNVWYALQSSQTAAAGAIDITINGSTVTGASAISVTSSSAGTSYQLYSIGSNSAASINSTGGILYINAGDVLGTSASSVAAGTVTFVTQEF